MRLKHLGEIENARLSEEIDNLALNIGGLICDSDIGLSDEKENRIIDAIRGGMTEILREYQPEKHAALPGAALQGLRSSSR